MVLHLLKRAKFLPLAIFFVSFCALSEGNKQINQKAFEGEYVVEPVKKGSAGVRSLSNDGKATRLGQSTFYLLSKESEPRELSLRTVKIKKQVTVSSNDKTCRKLLRRKVVKSCAPNYVMHTSDVTPNDPSFTQLWGMKSGFGANSSKAWGQLTNASNVVIAIIDTGMDYTHPDLSPNVWVNNLEIPGNGVDDDHNGIVDDIYGANFINNTGNPMDDNYHGTHVAGTIGAVGNNSIGVAGVAWNVKLLPLKFLDANGSGALSNAIKAIDYMVRLKNRGVNIRAVNNSWGGGGYAQPLSDAISRAKEAGIVFVAAAGNEANDNDLNPSYPASYSISNVLSVAALDSYGNLASFSNYGARSVGIAAPGVGIISTAPGNTYRSLSGTSMAAPHVTGALALLFSQNPSLSVEDAILKVLRSGVDTSTLDSVIRTKRRLDVGQLVFGEESDLPPPPALPESCAYGVSNIGFIDETSTTGLPILMQGDEGKFTEVALPFSFPFHRETYNSVFVSLNGVVYLKKAPRVPDFLPGVYAPVYAIAALHSDFVADAAPYGVRAYTSSSKVVIEWKMRYFTNRSEGGVTFKLVLLPNGVIKDYVAFDDQFTMNSVGNRFVMGVGAPVFTEGTNSQIAIKSRMGIQFTPACDGAIAQPVSPQVSTVRLTRMKRNIPLMANVDVKGALTGVGSGPIGIKLTVGNRECVANKSIELYGGEARFTARVPRLLRIYKTFEVTTNGAKGTINVGPPKSNQKSKSSKPLWKVSKKTFNNECSRLARSFRVN